MIDPSDRKSRENNLSGSREEGWPVPKNLLEIENLKTHFYTSAGVVKAVDGITYDVKEGETVAIVGESGCGKSVGAMSILQLIPDPPGKIVDGKIMFDGRDLLKLSPREMREIRG